MNEMGLKLALLPFVHQASANLRRSGGILHAVHTKMYNVQVYECGYKLSFRLQTRASVSHRIAMIPFYRGIVAIPFVLST